MTAANPNCPSCHGTGIDPGSKPMYHDGAPGIPDPAGYEPCECVLRNWTELDPMLASNIAELKEDLANAIECEDTFATVRIPALDNALRLLEVTLAKLSQARSLRLEWSSIRAALNPEVHTPARTIAFLKARGWVKEYDRRGGAVWQNVDLERSVFVPMETDYADWDKRMAELVHDLADAYGTGELQILADIAETEATDA